MKSKITSVLYKLLWPVTLVMLCITPLTGKETGKGEQLYLAHCGKCHGREGKGFLQLYPPLEKSHFLSDDIKQLPCIIRNGLKGELEINGKRFNGIMPPNQRISPEEMIILTSHLQKRWGTGETDLDIPLWLEQCPD
ncbi:cytochrome c [Desulfopila sp. IMCC35008]|uniref:c-type cytochrome n=1 Tax=Desulfopila sp. IMCC35008 TaxID=2653858 RepID=UPI0013D6CB6D|nr:cytochrome c [Desulfopila sp. IMCC35008]